MKPHVKELVESGLRLIPPHMHQGVRDYFYNGYAPGGFLNALLSNNLMETLGRADDINLHALPQWGRFLYNHTPAGSYGSPAAVTAWLSLFEGAQA